MADLNYVNLIGRMTADPELRTTRAGKPVCGFSIAVGRQISRQAQESGAKGVDFFDCVTWDQTAEFVAKWGAKGRLIVVEGRLETKDRENRDGQKWTGVEVNVSRLQTLDNPARNGGYRRDEEPDDPYGGS